MSAEGTLESITEKTYKEQAIWFLNGFWSEHQDQAEKMWDWVQKSSELDLQDGASGSGLDEMMTHRLLEILNETMTVREMRSHLKQTGAIGQNTRLKTIPLSYVILFKYKIPWKDFVNAPQGSNKEEMDRAQAKLDAVVAAFEESNARLEDARQAEAPFKAAQEELEAALAELKAQEEAYHGKIADCEKRSETGGVVTRNKAKAELAQLRAEDPLPLRRAKITTEAATKRAEKARAPFLVAREKADAAVQEARDRVKEAEEYMEEIKKKGGTPQGAVWWMQKEIEYQKKFLPSSKQ
eukprot:CAMPEP_0201551368 /NCGR_PEP_ID=MMETSP0173_2-20130828/7553_1 /ASSEMBLY_ACC=CAM_ASM_000268 /TAXON_ID=218659 /ORGANISM="Vexillifera sp., Strain DIVA3 564/2" /LENGTH=295 /DNA_ID=CAMNT_0047961597 /DNA_START=22 /DNA_END=909 /DNA_ORIENTATION=-